MDFNKEQIYINEIQPLVEQINDLCKNRKIPMFFSAAIKEENGQTDYKTVFCSSAQTEQRLDDDHIAKHILVSRGFHVHAFPSEVEMMDTVTDDFLTDSPLFEDVATVQMIEGD